MTDKEIIEAWIPDLPAGKVIIQFPKGGKWVTLKPVWSDFHLQTIYLMKEGIHEETDQPEAT